LTSFLVGIVFFPRGKAVGA